MCLLIGSTGVGKTLLSKRLNACSNRGSYTDLEEPPGTIPTVGTNMVNLAAGRKQDVVIREVGGSMAPIWHSYSRDCKALVYMVDMSNRLQVSASCIQFLDILNNPDLTHTPILLVLNKIDVPLGMSRLDFDYVFKLNEVRQHASQAITVLEVSAKEGQGLAEVAAWIQEHAPTESRP